MCRDKTVVSSFLHLLSAQTINAWNAEPNFWDVEVRVRKECGVKTEYNIGNMEKCHAGAVCRLTGSS